MSESRNLSRLASKANAVFNSVTANSTAITNISVGGVSVNSTAFPGTANNASNLAGVAAASYQLNSTLAANVATMAANSATFANGSSTNTFTIGTSTYFVANGNAGIGNSAPTHKLRVEGTLSTLSNTATIGTALYVGTNGNTSIATSNTTSARLRVDTTGGGGYGRTAPNIWIQNDNEPCIRMMNTANATLNHSATMYVPGGAGGWVVTCDTNNAFDLSVDINGNFTARGNVTAYSDERLKKDVANIADALSTVKSLRGVSYTRVDTGQKGVGFIAQELLDKIPEVVHENQEGYLTVAYGNMVALLVEAIKEQQKQIDELRDELRNSKFCSCP